MIKENLKIKRRNVIIILWMLIFADICLFTILAYLKANTSISIGLLAGLTVALISTILRYYEGAN